MLLVCVFSFVALVALQFRQSHPRHAGEAGMACKFSWETHGRVRSWLVMCALPFPSYMYLSLASLFALTSNIRSCLMGTCNRPCL